MVVPLNSKEEKQELKDIPVISLPSQINESN